MFAVRVPCDTLHSLPTHLSFPLTRCQTHQVFHTLVCACRALHQTPAFTVALQALAQYALGNTCNVFLRTIVALGLVVHGVCTC